MSEPDGARSKSPPRDAELLSLRKIVMQVVGFVIGMALLAWCIVIAVRGEGWSRIADASPLLVVGLVGCSVVSLTTNATIFWLLVRPVRHLGFWDMQWLNATTSVLNYAPIRLGLIARVAYHLRVDRLTLLELAAWFAALVYTLLLTLGACFVATYLRPTFDLVWAGLLAGQLVLGGLVTWTLMGQPLVSRFGRGMDQMLRRPSCLVGAIVLRLVDIGAFVGRMACAVAILGLDLSVVDTVLLGFAALALSLNPLGRTGFREIAVAFVASRLTAPDLTATQLESDMALLALVESAGEAMVFIPFGAVCLLWYRRRWLGARTVDGTAGPPVSDPA